jgi:predicted ATPase
VFPISDIELQFGATKDEKLRIPNPGVTLFVGPNNSGKSLVLREIWNVLRNGHGGGPGQILASMKCAISSAEREDSIIRRILADAKIAEDLKEDEKFTIRGTHPQILLSKAELRKFVRNPFSLGERTPMVVPSVMLDGATRLQLVGQQSLPSLSSPSTTFGRLATNDVARSRLRAVLFEAFQKYIVVDAVQSPGMAFLKFAPTVPPPSLERSFSDEALAFFQKCVGIELFSDGVRAFTGILAELFAGDPSVLVIDEPEAFLHPSLAYLLGREIARPAQSGFQKNVFIATHSPSFVMGCVQSSASVNVVRLTYANGQPTARVLKASDLSSLMRNPLLRSVGAIEALFHDFVVVTEADADRAFYDEINHRLLLTNDERGIQNCLFLRAQNKQTVADIVKPLRALGIPAAGIVDVDIYEEGGKVWSTFVDAAGMDATTAAGSAIVRSKVKDHFVASGAVKPKQRGGVNVLSGAPKKAADGLFDQLDDYGMFTVRGGEVEHWLPGTVKSSAHGPDWLIEAFKSMGEDPSDPGYLKPTDGDVWDFIAKIGRWLRNTSRKGM